MSSEFCFLTYAFVSFDWSTIEQLFFTPSVVSFIPVQHQYHSEVFLREIEMLTGLKSVPFHCQ